MLDCFLISDSEPNPEDAGDLLHAGSFTLEEFKLMKVISDYCGQTGIEFHYYRDLRFFTEHITYFFSLTTTIMSSDTTHKNEKIQYNQFHHMMETCLKENKGLICFCD
jgi:hypothetical protein